jgi:biopolymer transport protein ExbB
VEVVKASLARLQEALGGVKFQGAALAPNGVLEQGDFALFGPVALFASSQGDAAGIAELQMGSPEPTVIPIGEGTSRISRNWPAPAAAVCPWMPPWATP